MSGSPIPPETIGPAVTREAELSGFIGSLVRFPKPIGVFNASLTTPIELVHPEQL